MAMSLHAQCLQQIGFQLNLVARMIKYRTIDDEYVFHAFAERHDLGGVQVDLVFRQYIGNGVEQASAVVGGDRQQIILAAFIGTQIDRRIDREGA